MSSILRLLVLLLIPCSMFGQNIFTYKVGLVEISLLSEGQSTGNSSILIGATEEMKTECIPNDTFPNAANAFLIRTPNNIMLVDAGFGRNLFTNLQQLNVTPEQVNVILLTHMHNDHIGGLLQNGKASFPNAQVYLSQAEHDYWLNFEGERSMNAKKVIEVYKNKLHLFQPNKIGEKGDSLLSGIYAIAAYGHTPGHTCYLVESGKEKMLIWGDLVHAMAIQMKYPKVAITYDTDPKEAIASREKILEFVTQKNIPIAGMHIAFPAMESIKKGTVGYTYTELKK